MNSPQNMNPGPKLDCRLIDDTDTPCLHCAAMGHTNYGGSTPTLKRLPDNQRRENEPDMPFCIVHGYVPDSI